MTIILLDFRGFRGTGDPQWRSTLRLFSGARRNLLSVGPVVLVLKLIFGLDPPGMGERGRHGAPSSIHDFFVFARRYSLPSGGCQQAEKRLFVSVCENDSEMPYFDWLISQFRNNRGLYDDAIRWRADEEPKEEKAAQNRLTNCKWKTSNFASAGTRNQI